MNRTRFVTFPRSGHHWLVGMLQERIHEMRYDEHHSTGNTLETCPEINAQKTHDFDLDVPKNPDYFHVIQLRNPLDCIKSWHKLPGQEPSFEVFSLWKSEFFVQWFDKWVRRRLPMPSWYGITIWWLIQKELWTGL